MDEFMEFYNKHYIRVQDTMVVKGFSDAFESPLDSDICINKQGGRHFELDGVVNPPLYMENGCHLYRYENNEIRLATPEELQEELNKNYAEPAPTEEELQWQAITDLEIAQLEYQLKIDNILNGEK